MKVLKPYDQLFKDSTHYALLKSGRDAGKSSVLYQLVTHNLFKYIDLDVIVCRSNYGDLQKSLFNGILKYIENEKLIQFVETRTRPLKITNKLNGNVIYFEGIGGADLSRSKGLEPDNKVSLIVIDECQQLPKQENLDQALATFRRHLHHRNWKVVIAFNPERQNSHWLNEFFRINEPMDTWLTLHTSYRDIAKVLTKVDLEAIRLEKMINNSNYRYLYLGETEGLFGGVYHTFNRNIHLVKEAQARKLMNEIGIYTVLIGVDGATTRDKTAFVPTVVLNNGQGIVLDYFYHDPIKNGALSNDRLVPYVQNWLDLFNKRWGIRHTQRIEMIYDSASADLRLVCAYRLPKRYVHTSYSQKNIVQMAQIMQNAFSRNVLYILDDNGIFNYVTNRKEYYFHPLVTQLESVIWDEDGKGFDKMVENDVTDALTYSIAFYFKNPNAIYFPKLKDYYERSDE